MLGFAVDCPAEDHRSFSLDARGKLEGSLSLLTRMIHGMRTARCQMGELLGYLLRSGCGPLMMERAKKYNQS